MTLTASATCRECGRVFDLLNSEADRDAFYLGHDCEDDYADRARWDHEHGREGE